MDPEGRIPLRDPSHGMPLAVGHIGAPHGIRGEVTVDVCTDDPDVRFAPGAVLSTEPPARGPLTVRATRRHRGRLLVSFAESPDRTAAESLRGSTLLVHSADLPVSEVDDEFRDHELIDLAVVTVAGRRVGTVADVFHPPGQDLLAVLLRGGGEAYVPFVAAIVNEVDRNAGVLLIDPPPGLIDTGTVG